MAALSPSLSRGQLAVLVVALAGAAVAAVMWIWRSPSTLSPDEIFQTVEQAYRWLHGRGTVPWEFRDGVRSWLLPGFLAAPVAAGELFGPRGHLVLTFALLAGLATATPLTAFFTTRRVSPETGSSWSPILAAILCAGWVEILFYAPRPLSEVVATHALLPALHLCSISGTRGRRQLFAAGLLLALAVVVRLQLAPVALLAAVWGCRRDLGRWRALLLGAAGPLLLAAIVDTFTWGAPFRSTWRYFDVNILQGKSAGYSVSPWPSYLFGQARVWGAAGGILLGFAAVAARRAPLLALSAVTIVLVHSAIPHKEHRFVYPALALLIVLAACGVALTVEWLRARRVPLVAGWLAGALLWGAMAGFVAGRLAEDRVEIFPPNRVRGVPLWRVRRGPLRAFRSLAVRPRPCGVALVKVAWWETGGHSWLVHDTLIYQDVVDAADVVVTRVPDWSAPGWSRHRCFDDVCVYRRQLATCAPRPEASLNPWLVRRNL